MRITYGYGDAAAPAPQTSAVWAYVLWGAVLYSLYKVAVA